MLIKYQRTGTGFSHFDAQLWCAADYKCHLITQWSALPLYLWSDWHLWIKPSILGRKYRQPAVRSLSGIIPLLRFCNKDACRIGSAASHSPSECYKTVLPHGQASLWLSDSSLLLLLSVGPHILLCMFDVVKTFKIVFHKGWLFFFGHQLKEKRNLLPNSLCTKSTFLLISNKTFCFACDN